MKGPIKNQGKGSVIIIIIIEDPKKTIPGREIGMKYLGTLDHTLGHPIVRMILHSVQERKSRSY